MWRGLASASHRARNSPEHQPFFGAGRKSAHRRLSLTGEPTARTWRKSARSRSALTARRRLRRELNRIRVDRSATPRHRARIRRYPRAAIFRAAGICGVFAERSRGKIERDCRTCPKQRTCKLVAVIADGHSRARCFAGARRDLLRSQPADKLMPLRLTNSVLPRGFTFAATALRPEKVEARSGDSCQRNPRVRCCCLHHQPREGCTSNCFAADICERPNTTCAASSSIPATPIAARVPKAWALLPRQL